MEVFQKYSLSLRITLVVAPIFAIIIAFDLIPFLRGGEIFHWMWPYQPVSVGRVALLAGGLLVYLVGAYRLGQLEKARWLLIWAFCMGIILPVGVIALRYDAPLAELYFRTLSPTATGPYFAGAQIDWNDPGWHDWPATMREYREISQHVALSPPGLPLFYRGLATLFASFPRLSNFIHTQLLPLQCHNYSALSFTPSEWAAALFGMMMPLWAACALFPLYGLGKILAGSAARWIAAAWPLIPALILYTPTWNTLYPTGAVFAFYLLLRGMKSRKGDLWFLGSGFIFGLLTFANFSIVPLAALCGFYVLLRHTLNEREHSSWHRPLRIGAGFGLGALLIWFVFGFWIGSWPLAMLDTAFEKHLGLERPYLPWLWMHSWEWALLNSIPFVGLWFGAALRWRKGEDVLPLALLATMTLLLLSNTARGETGRVWIFFTPFVLLAGGQALRADSGQKAPVMILFAQALFVLALTPTWNVMSAPDIQASPTAPPLHESLRPVDARFDAGFRLIGWDGIQDDDEIVLKLHWQAEQQGTLPVYFAALPVAPDGSTGQAINWQPGETRYPVPCWVPGKITADTIHIPLVQDAPEGGWYISLTVFTDVENPMQTSSITLADGTQDRQIGLGPIMIHASDEK